MRTGSTRASSSSVAACVVLCACSGAITPPAQTSEVPTPWSTAGSGGPSGSPFAAGGGGFGFGGFGGFGGDAAGAQAAPMPAVCRSADTGEGVLRRLSREEYPRTREQLLQLPAPPAIDEVPEDAEQRAFRTVVELQGVTDQHLLAHHEVAERLSGELMADVPRSARVIGCDLAAADCLPSFVARLGRLAFRRTLDAMEAESLTSAAAAGAIDGPDAFRLAIEALLTSASFLFRVEIGDGAQLATLVPSELASRLSFLLFCRGPSAELLGCAEAGELASPQGLLADAREMLAAEVTHTGMRSFFKQWLRYEPLRVPAVTPPGFSEALLPDMIGETERVLDDFAFQPGARFADVLAVNYTYVTPALGAFYGSTCRARASRASSLPPAMRAPGPVC